MATVKIDGLAEAIAKELHEYSEEVTEEVKESVKAAAKACVATLRQTSPKSTGDYAKGWAARTAYEGPDDIRMQVHNRTDYQLTHLLEDGHESCSTGLHSGGMKYFCRERHFHGSNNEPGWDKLRIRECFWQQKCRAKRFLLPARTNFLYCVCHQAVRPVSGKNH